MLLFSETFSCSHPPKHPPPQLKTTAKPYRARLPSPEPPEPGAAAWRGPGRPVPPAVTCWRSPARPAGTAPPRCVSVATAATASRSPGLGEALLALRGGGDARSRLAAPAARGAGAASGARGRGPRGGELGPTLPCSRCPSLSG